MALANLSIKTQTELEGSAETARIKDIYIKFNGEVLKILFYSMLQLWSVYQITESKAGERL